MMIAPEELTRPDRHIFLSPHYDDIALSCGGTAAVLSAAGRTPRSCADLRRPSRSRPTADQLCAAAPQAVGHGSCRGDLGSTGRRAHGVRSARHMRPLPAVPRCDLSRRAVPERRRPLRSGQDREADLAGKIIDELRLCADGASNTRIYAPLAIGHHVDHQHAYLAGLELIRRGWEVWFYEDLPYGLKPANVDARREQIAQDGLKPGPAVDVGSQWKRKVDAIMAYPSQLSTIFGQYVGVGTARAAIDEAMSTYARSMGDGAPAERFWSRHE